MKENKKTFLKVWGVPVLLSLITLLGLISAIMGIGVWHYFSWFALSVPVYVMIKYGSGYFK